MESKCAKAKSLRKKLGKARQKLTFFFKKMLTGSFHFGQGKFQHFSSYFPVCGAISKFRYTQKFWLFLPLKHTNTHFQVPPAIPCSLTIGKLQKTSVYVFNNDLITINVSVSTTAWNKLQYPLQNNFGY